MSNLESLFRDAVANGLRRKSITTPSKWAQNYRVMPTPFPGKWTPDPTPWTLAMHDSEAPVNIGQKAAQMGYTETVLNITFFNIDIKHMDCLYVLPSKTPDASEFSAARFDVALELSPHLEELFSNVKNVGHKRAGAANLYIRGSNSRSGLKSIPAASLIFDEVDEMNQVNIPLAEERTSGQLLSLIWKISTPTIPNKRINKVFLASTQEHYVFKCPHCNRHTELSWPESIVITAESYDDPRLKDTYLICQLCKGILPHETKREWLGVNNARWESFGNPKLDTRGFYINQLYSIPSEPWIIAKKYFEGLSDKASEQEFFNSKMGLPHIVEGAQIQDIEIDDAISDRRKEDVAPESKLITMGVDQGRWLHYEINAWTFPKLGNDLNMSAKCQVLTEGKCVDFEELDILMKQWQVMQCVIDAQPDRRKAYEFAVRFWGHVKLCFYGRGQQKKTISISPDEDEHTITVDRTSWLDVALNRFRTKTIIVPQNISTEYRDHLKAMIRVYSKDKDDNPTSCYMSNGADHFAHARCYAEIALPLAASIVTSQNIPVFL
jgi:hypothetical protein